MRALALVALLLLGAGQADAPSSLPVAAAIVEGRLPHDPNAFTEGLFFRDGHFFESTGEPGTSFIREVDPATGRVLRQVAIAAPTFGEGIAPAGDTIISLTWKDGIGWRWRSRDFQRIGRFFYAGEGWALTTDGRRLIMSDGTPVLRFLDPATLRETGRLPVTADGRLLPNLNELEWVDGEILANIWMTNRIARIDPKTGHVIGWIDVSALTAEIRPRNNDAVPNGIAWDAAHRRLYVTGKDWQTIFRIRPPHGD